MRRHAKILALASVILGIVATSGSVTAVPARAASTARIAATGQLSPRLNNGRWCENFFNAGGVDGYPCLTFSGGFVRGYMFFGNVVPGCTIDVFVQGLNGHYDQAYDLPCKVNAGTYFTRLPEDDYQTLVNVYINGVYQGSGWTDGHVGP